MEDSALTVIDFKTKTTTETPEGEEKVDLVAQALDAAKADNFDHVFVIGIKHTKEDSFGMSVFTSIFDPMKTIGLLELTKNNYIKSISG